MSEFVEALKTELESTFKEEISVYFDINPNDGLLETHDVDASLKEKLKCLLFIPIISRTYCDPRSFAWDHEFKTFVEQASVDRFGLKIKLSGSNVVSRVLPVCIYDLDKADKKLCESILGGELRGIEFIYKERGVNRPLSPKDQDERNLNKTNYRNQINKVANSIKEIISGLKPGSILSDTQKKEVLLAIDTADLPEKSIAVLPFVSMSSEKDQDYFCDGMAEEIINALAHNENLKVISRTSAFAFKDKPEDIREIGKKKKVIPKLHSENIEAYKLYLKGTNYWQMLTAEGYRTAAECFEQALQKDPNYAFAYIGLSYVTGYSTAWGNLPPNIGFPKIRQYINKVLELDNTLADAYSGLAGLNLYYYWNWKEAERNFKIALEINPNNSQIHLDYSNFLTFNGRHEEAISEAKKAQELDPFSIYINTYTGFAFDYAGQYDKAIDEYRRTLTEQPQNRHLQPVFLFVAVFNQQIIKAYSFCEIFDFISFINTMHPCQIF